MNFSDTYSMEDLITMWGVFFVIVPVLLFCDLFVFYRKDHAIGLKESLKLSGFYIGIGLLFGLWIYYKMGAEHAFDYYTAFVLEKSLSLDNLFVISVIFTACAIPREYQHRVLIYGIIGVIVLRALMIGTGIVLVHKFGWILLVFAAILIFTGIKLMFMAGGDEEFNFEERKLVIFLRKHLRFTPVIEGTRFWVRGVSAKSGKTVWLATPLFLALVVVEITDVMFAFDSIPAVLAITTDTYVVYTSNIFAILGLRALFFAAEHMLSRFSLMQYALALVLIIIGGKVFYNEFIGHVNPAVSLALTLGILLGGMIFSVLMTTDKENQDN